MRKKLYSFVQISAVHLPYLFVHKEFEGECERAQQYAVHNHKHHVTLVPRRQTAEQQYIYIFFFMLLTVNKFD